MAEVTWVRRVHTCDLFLLLPQVLVHIGSVLPHFFQREVFSEVATMFQLFLSGNAVGIGIYSTVASTGFKEFVHGFFQLEDCVHGKIECE
jgi:hypothetical protein